MVTPGLQQLVDRALAQHGVGFGELGAVVHAKDLLLIFGERGVNARPCPRARLTRSGR